MPRSSRAASSSVLGKNFSVFRRILRSETVPPEEDLSGLWGELCAARLKTFVFQVFTNQSDGIVNLPAYAAWLLFHALAWRADDGRPSDYLIRSAIGFIRLNNQWMQVRDELFKFGVLVVEELNMRSDREANLLGESGGARKPNNNGKPGNPCNQLTVAEKRKRVKRLTEWLRAKAEGKTMNDFLNDFPQGERGTIRAHIKTAQKWKQQKGPKATNPCQ